LPQLPDDQDPAWDSIAAQWRDICVKEGITRGTSQYAARANKFFDDLYLAAVQQLNTDTTGG